MFSGKSRERNVSMKGKSTTAATAADTVDAARIQRAQRQVERQRTLAATSMQAAWRSHWSRSRMRAEVLEGWATKMSDIQKLSGVFVAAGRGPLVPPLPVVLTLLRQAVFCVSPWEPSTLPRLAAMAALLTSGLRQPSNPQSLQRHAVSSPASFAFLASRLVGTALDAVALAADGKGGGSGVFAAAAHLRSIAEFALCATSAGGSDSQGVLTTGAATRAAQLIVTHPTAGPLVTLFCAGPLLVGTGGGGSSSGSKSDMLADVTQLVVEMGFRSLGVFAPIEGGSGGGGMHSCLAQPAGISLAPVGSGSAAPIDGPAAGAAVSHIRTVALLRLSGHLPATTSGGGAGSIHECAARMRLLLRGGGDAAAGSYSPWLVALTALASCSTSTTAGHTRAGPLRLPAPPLLAHRVPHSAAILQASPLWWAPVLATVAALQREYCALGSGSPPPPNNSEPAVAAAFLGAIAALWQLAPARLLSLPAPPPTSPSPFSAAAAATAARMMTAVPHGAVRALRAGRRVFQLPAVAPVASSTGTGTSGPPSSSSSAAAYGSHQPPAYPVDAVTGDLQGGEEEGDSEEHRGAVEDEEELRANRDVSLALSRAHQREVGAVLELTTSGGTAALLQPPAQAAAAAQSTGSTVPDPAGRLGPWGASAAPSSSFLLLASASLDRATTAHPRKQPRTAQPLSQFNQVMMALRGAPTASSSSSSSSSGGGGATAALSLLLSSPLQSQLRALWDGAVVEWLLSAQPATRGAGHPIGTGLPMDPALVHHLARLLGELDLRSRVSGTLSVLYLPWKQLQQQHALGGLNGSPPEQQLLASLCGGGGAPLEGSAGGWGASPSADHTAVTRLQMLWTLVQQAPAFLAPAALIGGAGSSGSSSVPSAAISTAALDLTAAASAHQRIVALFYRALEQALVHSSLGDIEFFEGGTPLPPAAAAAVVEHTRSLLYRLFWMDAASQDTPLTQRPRKVLELMASAIAVYNNLFDRHSRRPKGPERHDPKALDASAWLWPVLPASELSVDVILGIADDAVDDQAQAAVAAGPEATAHPAGSSSSAGHSFPSSSSSSSAAAGSDAASAAVSAPQHQSLGGVRYVGRRGIRQARVQLILTHFPQVVPFATRVSLFAALREKDRVAHSAGSGGALMWVQGPLGPMAIPHPQARVKVRVRRNFLFQDAFNAFAAIAGSGEAPGPGAQAAEQPHGGGAGLGGHGGAGGLLFDEEDSTYDDAVSMLEEEEEEEDEEAYGFQARQPHPQQHQQQPAVPRLSPEAAARRFKDPFSIEFINREGLHEAGIDGGGLMKEFIDCTVKETFSPALGLFRETAAHTMYPHTSAAGPGLSHGSSPQQQLAHFEFAGRLLGKALYEGILVEPRFANFFLRKLLGKANLVDDLASLDPELHRHLMQLKRVAAAVSAISAGDPIEDLSLVMAVSEEVEGAPSSSSSSSGPQTRVITVPLLPGGEHIPVTRHTVSQYIALLANYRLNTQIAPQCRAFLTGFRSLIPLSWMRMFGPAELQTLIGGSEKDIDLVDLRANTVYSGGYADSQPYIQDFWSVLAGLSQADLRSFLAFTTSCSRPPLLGFGALKPHFGIQRVPISADNEKLPSSGTCFNALKLPKYSSKEVLREKLLVSLRSGAGFELS